MYSLVAIGFVLIYKTSGVLNFAQGPLLLFAALTYVSLVERGVPAPLSLVIVFAVDGVDRSGDRTQRCCARSPIARRSRCSWRRWAWPMSSRAARSCSGAAQVHGLDIGVSDTPFDVYGVFVSKFDLFAAAVAAPDGGGVSSPSSNSRGSASPSAPPPPTPTPPARSGCDCP